MTKKKTTKSTSTKTTTTSKGGKRGPKPGTKYNTKKPMEKLKEKQIDERIIETLYKAGLTDKEFAQLMDISVRTLHRYKQDQNFLSLLKKGKNQADDMVEMALFKNAVGFSIMETQTHNYQGQIIKTDIEKYFKGETTAQFIWLKNRRPDQWRDKIEGNSGALPEDDGDNFKEVHVHVHSSKSKLI